MVMGPSKVSIVFLQGSGSHENIELTKLVITPIQISFFINYLVNRIDVPLEDQLQNFLGLYHIF